MEKKSTLRFRPDALVLVGWVIFATSFFVEETWLRLTLASVARGLP